MSLLWEKTEIKIYPPYGPVMVQFDPLKPCNSTRLTQQKLWCSI
jgi:hypothetical protein